jgi:RNA polymerase sigma-70 factor, ECF subfamily
VRAERRAMNTQRRFLGNYRGRDIWEEGEVKFIACNKEVPLRYSPVMAQNFEAAKIDDARLILSVQTGDQAAFSELLDLHLTHVRTFLALRSPVAHLVDELAHDTFVFAYRRIGEFKPGTSFRAWLRAIAWNLLRQEIQRAAREQVQHARFAEWQLTDLENNFDSAAAPEAEHLQECLDQVGQPLRELLALKYREGHTTDEIAARMNRSLAWVRVALFRVRAQLRSCIEANLIGGSRVK